MSNIVLVTGSSSGIGRATTERFARQGWTVIATMRRAAERAPSFGWPDNVHPVELDVDDPNSLDRAYRLVMGRWGPPDVLVNNAGWPALGPVEELEEERVRGMFETNFFGLLRVVRAFVPAMRERGSGVIVNVSSIGGKLVMPFYAPYQATKHAVEAVTAGLWMELRPYGIRVFSIQPGIIKTDFYGRSMQTSRALEEGDSPYQERFERFLAIQGTGERWGSPPRAVAERIWKAVRRGRRLNRAAGRGARAMLYLRRILPENLFHWLVHMVTRVR